jgi:hypothetical protein
MRLSGYWAPAVFAGLLWVAPPVSAQTVPQDIDQDGYEDEIDKCPWIYNPDPNGICADSGLLQASPEAATLFSTLFYDVDFGTPPHTVSKRPVADYFGPAPRNAPSGVYLGAPIVVASEGALDQQPLRFGSGTSRYDQVGFGIAGTGFDDKLPFYHFELTVMCVSGAPTILPLLVIFFDAPHAHQIRFLPDGRISALTLGDDGQETGSGRWEAGVPIRVVVDIEWNKADWRNSHWTIALDGEEVLSGPFPIYYLSSGHGLISLRVSARQFVVVALDDVLVSGGSIRPVGVDVLPDTDPNPINPSGEGVVPVTLLGSQSFDVADVDGATLSFGPNDASLAHWRGPHFEDLNGDGVMDLLAHFRVEETGIAFGDRLACLSGEMLDGTRFGGCDSVRTVPDMDGDRLLDVEEDAIGTEALRPDTDGDGHDDGAEVYVLGTDPLDPLDPPPALVRERGHRRGRRH